MGGAKPIWLDPNPYVNWCFDCANKDGFLFKLDGDQNQIIIKVEIYKINSSLLVNITSLIANSDAIQGILGGSK